MSEFIEPFDLGEGDAQRRLHLGRYNWANEMVKGFVVANAACSTNYGYEILKKPGRLVIGFDRNDSALDIARRKNRDWFIKMDIEKERFDGFTALVCLETFEHLKEPWEFLKGLSQTVKELVLSVPCIPTKHLNEWHLHDFTVNEVREGLNKLRWQINNEALQDEPGLPCPTYFLVYATRK
jgi:2-polyprenyl-3-methyl-5-hydroxy-6-metoxy-1,4-benzoquinol methylase